MEAIAEAADLSLSTLYRCFPSKDLIVLAAISADTAILAEALEAIPASAPVDEALATAILAFFYRAEHQPNRLSLLRSILDQTPRARARLWDLLSEPRNRLGRELAKRQGLKEQDPRVILSARVALLITETAADMWRAPGNRRSARTLALTLIPVTSEGEVTVPKLASKNG
jgi:AcrR family transcriptional regulator